jgi:hypothetical protein
MKEENVRATAWVPIMVLAMAAPVACQDKNPPSKGTVVPTDREVVITLSGSTISVEPETALVAKGQPLKFTVGAMRGATTVEIDFVTGPAEGGADEGKPYVGPFPKRENDAKNPQRGRYVLTPGQSWTTEPAAVLGYWKYQVIVRGPDGEYSLDPGVIIKEGT